MSADDIDPTRRAQIMTEIEQLRGFANYLMSGDDIDGGDVQDAAVEFGLLQAFEVSEPCGESCVCVEYGDFPQVCYRKTKLLTGEPA